MCIKYAYVAFIREQFGIRTIKNKIQFICGLFNESLRQTVLHSGVQIFQKIPKPLQNSRRQKVTMK